MFDKYMICEDTVRNVIEDGRVAGFQFGARLPYYRGLGLSMIEDVAVTVDGEKLPRESVRITLRGRTYTLDQMETEYEDRWEMGEVAIVTVCKPGGLNVGAHQLELLEQLRVSYLPFPLMGRDRKDVTMSRDA